MSASGGRREFAICIVTPIWCCCDGRASLMAQARPVSVEAADAVTAAGWCGITRNFTVRLAALAAAGLRRDLTRVYAFCRFTDDLGDGER